MRQHVFKWVKTSGELLDRDEYKIHFSNAQSLDMELEEYFKQLGIKAVLSYGENQSPWNNSAKLVSWYIYDEGELKLLTNWKYCEYFNESKDKGITITELLKEKGYKEYSTLINEKEDVPTRWINLTTNQILYRKDYLKLSRLAKSLNMTLKEYLHENNFYNVLDSKKHVIKNIINKKYNN